MKSSLVRLQHIQGSVFFMELLSSLQIGESFAISGLFCSEGVLLNNKPG